MSCDNVPSRLLPRLDRKTREMADGALQYMDFSQSGASNNKRSPEMACDGFEAPRNSFRELPFGPHQIYNDIPISWCLKPCSDAGSVYAKKLVGDEISGSVGRSYSCPVRSSVVSRLIGIDAPSCSGGIMFVDDVGWIGEEKQESDRRKPREHPQEELLQKFKKDFEAWQSTKLLDCSRSIEASSSIKCREQKTGKTSPSRIVILRPCSDGEEPPVVRSPEMTQREINMEEFLEEVKRKLKSEIEGKCARSRPDRWIGGETSPRKQPPLPPPPDPKKLPWSMASLSSKFTRMASAPESERDAGIRLSYSRRSNSLSCDDFVGMKPACRSNGEDVGRRTLVRSLSAPESGLSFTKLQPENGNAPAGVSGNRSPAQRKHGKEAFDIKSRVSSLKHNFSLRRKIFSRKLPSRHKSLDEFAAAEMLSSPPSTFRSSSFVHDNDTEVPPSPASMCSSPTDGTCRVGYPSPVSPLEVTFSEDPSSSSSCSSSHSIRKSSMPSGDAESRIREQTPACNSDNDRTTESGGRAYVRKVLIAAGIYGGRNFTTVPGRVYEELESLSNNHNKTEESPCRRIMFDLVNEALPSIARHSPSTTVSIGYQRWFLCLGEPPRGENLLNDLWRCIQILTEPPKELCPTIDTLIARDLHISRWSGVPCDDVEGIGNKMEAQVVEELVEELVWDFLLGRQGRTV